MKHTNTDALSFVYTGNAESISAAFKRSNTACPSDMSVVLTGIDTNGHLMYSKSLLFDNSFDHFAYARLEMAVQSGLFDGLVMQRLSRTLVRNKERNERPIMVFKKNIVYADKLGIMPWHTMYFAGKYVYVYIWDTRELVRVMTIKECEGIASIMLKPALDNLQPIWSNDWRAWPADAIDEMLKPSQHPAFNNGTQLDAILSNMQ